MNHDEAKTASQPPLTKWQVGVRAQVRARRTVTVRADNAEDAADEALGDLIGVWITVTAAPEAVSINDQSRVINETAAEVTRTGPGQTWEVVLSSWIDIGRTLTVEAHNAHEAGSSAVAEEPAGVWTVGGEPDAPAVTVSERAEIDDLRVGCMQQV